jgi:hypothetical protein
LDSGRSLSSRHGTSDTSVSISFCLPFHCCSDGRADALPALSPILTSTAPAPGRGSG